MYSLISAVSTTLQMLRTVKFWEPSVTVQERWLHSESCLEGKLIILGITAAVQRFCSVRWVYPRFHKIKIGTCICIDVDKRSQTNIMNQKKSKTNKIEIINVKMEGNFYVQHSMHILPL